MKKRVYISGKIGERVITEATRRKFAKAEEMLKAIGYDTFNPTGQEWQEHLHKKYLLDKEEQPNGEKVGFYAYALLRDLMVLATCDAIYVLEDWKRSGGARTEYEYALATGKKMLFQERWDACTYLDHILAESWKACRPLMLPEEGEDDWDCTMRFRKKHTNEVWLPL